MRLFPKELIEYSAESHFARYSVTSKVIYSLTVGLITLVALLLPVLQVNVGLRGQGLIIPAQDRAEIVSFVSGRVSEVHVEENRSVKRGDLIARVDPGERVDKLQTINENISRLELYLEDLNTLSGVNFHMPPSIPAMGTNTESESVADIIQNSEAATKTRSDSMAGTELVLVSNRYRLSYDNFMNSMMDKEAEIDLNRQVYNRNRELYSRELISREQFESVSHRYHQSVNEKKRLLAQQKSSWSEERVELEMQLEKLKNDSSTLSFEIDQYTILAPVNGTVTQLHSLLVGGTVFQRQTLGEISPDTTLLAEIYVPPSEIGYIRHGMPVHLRIDAFSSNEWGVLEGVVTSISPDAVMESGTPFFIIQTTLNRTHLELATGFRGELKKGMTLQARFLLAKRTLFQLLFDSVDDWLNPVWSLENN